MSKEEELFGDNNGVEDLNVVDLKAKRVIDPRDTTQMCLHKEAIDSREL